MEDVEDDHLLDDNDQHQVVGRVGRVGLGIHRIITASPCNACKAAASTFNMAI